MINLIFVDQTRRSFKKLSVEKIDEIENGYEIFEILIEPAESPDFDESEVFPSALDAFEYLIEFQLRDKDILYFVPDSFDGREEIRIRLFNTWISKLRIRDKVAIVNKRCMIGDGQEVSFTGIFLEHQHKDSLQKELEQWFDLIMGY
jgi:hypothetical protein